MKFIGTTKGLKRLVILSGLALTVILAAPAPYASEPAQFLYITVPAYAGLNPVAVPPITTFRWETLSTSAVPLEVRYILVGTDAFNGSWSATEDYVRNNPSAPEWSSWNPYAPPTTGTFWTTPPQDAGYYVFAVQGRDENGDAEEFDARRNMRRVRVIGTVPADGVTWGAFKVDFRTE